MKRGSEPSCGRRVGAAGCGIRTDRRQCAIRRLQLNALRESRNAAAQLIQRSCDALYRNNAMLLPRERRFHECVVQSLPGVRDNYAIQQIMSICSRRGEM